MRRAFLICLAVSGIIFASRFALNPSGSQAHAFLGNGSMLFSDFLAPRAMSATGNPYQSKKYQPKDVNYPALCYLIIRPFPETKTGAVAFTAVFGLAFLFSLHALAIRYRLPQGSELLAVFAAPFIFALERGNLIWPAAAGVTLFFAWYDDQKPWKRGCAAAALAFAGVLKITPAIFVLIYLREKRWRDFVFCAGVAALLTFAPFWIIGDGFSDILIWVRNVTATSQHYGLQNSWGFTVVDRTLRAVWHLPIDEPWAAFPYERAVAVVLGVLSVVMAMVTREHFLRIMLLINATLLIPSNQMYYCGLFFISAAVIFFGESTYWTEKDNRPFGWILTVLFLLMFFPIQIPVGAGSFNRPLANLVFLVFTFLSLGLSVRCGRTRRH